MAAELRNLSVPDPSNVEDPANPKNDWLLPILPVIPKPEPIDTRRFRDTRLVDPNEYFDQLRKAKPAEDDPEDDDSD